MPGSATIAWLGNTAASATYATLDPANKSANISLSLGSLKATGNSSPGMVKATISKSSGKWYWEFTVNTQGFSGSSFSIGIADASYNVNSGVGPGQDTHAYTCWDDGGKEFNNVFVSGYTANQVVGTVIGIALDLDGGTITYYFNGVSQGVMYSGITGTWFPMYYGDVFANACTFNFGATAFSGSVPVGYNSGFYS